ncbi:MAG: hypothetical protein SVS85_02000, partial [Candidatus Nanohaloarchaea archaeon]|nr:hypothetical protein [Candidatus Nanohaloarchaea archaeon]
MSDIGDDNEMGEANQGLFRSARRIISGLGEDQETGPEESYPGEEERGNTSEGGNEVTESGGVSINNSLDSSVERLGREVPSAADTEHSRENAFIEEAVQLLNQKGNLQEKVSEAYRDVAKAAQSATTTVYDEGLRLEEQTAFNPDEVKETRRTIEDSIIPKIQDSLVSSGTSVSAGSNLKYAADVELEKSGTVNTNVSGAAAKESKVADAHKRAAQEKTEDVVDEINSILEELNIEAQREAFEEWQETYSFVKETVHSATGTIEDAYDDAVETA